MLPENVVDRSFRENQAFEQRIGGQAIGAMQAGAGGFAGDIEAGQVGASAQIADDAAAGVVRRRHDRDRFAGDVDAQFEAAGMDVREVFADEILALVRDVEINAVEAAFLHLEVDGAGDDVARCQFGRARRARA